MAPIGEDNKQPEVYVCVSPGFKTGFFPTTPSPSTISLLFKHTVHNINFLFVYKLQLPL